MKRRRADELLKEEHSLQSIELARALIMEGRVLAGDRKILSSSEMLPLGTSLRVKGKELDAYVSRGAYKLKKAVELFHIDLQGACCIDVGSSTGGFTDVMLRAGAKKVYCVDVGYNLLDYRLRSDERVTVMERTNARFLTKENFPEAPEFGATDVSFISLKAILPSVLPLLEGRREFVALIKPQFEAPKEDVGEKGVVRDAKVHERVLFDMVEFIASSPWAATDLSFSPVRGQEGNIEFLLHLLPRDQGHTDVNESLIRDTILTAYDNFVKAPRGDL